MRLRLKGVAKAIPQFVTAHTASIRGTLAIAQIISDMAFAILTIFFVFQALLYFLSNSGRLISGTDAYKYATIIVMLWITLFVFSLAIEFTAICYHHDLSHALKKIRVYVCLAESFAITSFLLSFLIAYPLIPKVFIIMIAIIDFVIHAVNQALTLRSDS